MTASCIDKYDVALVVASVCVTDTRNDIICNAVVNYVTVSKNGVDHNDTVFHSTRNHNYEHNGVTG